MRSKSDGISFNPVSQRRDWTWIAPDAIRWINAIHTYNRDSGWTASFSVFVQPLRGCRAGPLLFPALRTGLFMLNPFRITIHFWTDTLCGYPAIPCLEINVMYMGFSPVPPDKNRDRKLDLNFHIEGHSPGTRHYMGSELCSLEDWFTIIF